MQRLSDIMRGMIAARGGKTPMASPRRSRKAALSWDCLEERTVLSHFGFSQGFGGGLFFGTGGFGRTQGSTQNTQLTTDVKQLKSDIENDPEQVDRDGRPNRGGPLRFPHTRASWPLPQPTIAPDLREQPAHGSRRLGPRAITARSRPTRRAPSRRSSRARSARRRRSNAQVSQLFNDLLGIAKASNITSSDLATIATDQSKIQADRGTTSTGSTTSHGAGYAGGIASAPAASLLIPGF